ncbi:thiamine pyrophosphate-binding protein [Lactiplantibacillus pentosus]|uniref:Thiamine pyrophosphate-binding protein n=1 Tax=Lactiplantibacillus pentosus TaxID=1589 RepID=A0AAW8VYQ8_LACPE|nr:thiamine pyrophosphate-binding protein [Lactiplantibacillus pentosus]AUI79500.1 pyruvate oxidase [Lactiplantibacillus pentosus]MBU7473420.1 pyruvate oxidase [Lactiplantibacillus pentosus]MBU7528680.1 pyruvate oxidase [Lactiplantibacillus pentosus]MCA1343479.1 pyruvate oxidase [Lactiplantibacillus pentosus]MCE6031119.1 thiamine pyrophosphate-dependent enzyme [Lactiplantibacillus pentosus]
MTKMIAGQALVKVLEAWDVDHIYGIPGGSINHTVEGLYLEKAHIDYIQVRHEEVGALAASADAKFTSKIGVSFGSAGPGATHLFNGLYDAKMDHVPVLALVGQVPQATMNTNYFQEMDETPMFSDVAVYNRTVTTAAQLPYVINQAIREAYRQKGPAVVIIPENLSAEEIDYEPVSTPNTVSDTFEQRVDPQAITATMKLLKAAKHPLVYAGRGLLGAKAELVKFSEQFNLPVMNTVPATGVIPTNHPNAIGTFGRLGSKSGFEALQHADLILFLGSEFPFASFWPKGIKIIQVNNNSFDIGKMVPIDYAVISDAKAYLQAMIDTGESLPETAWLTTNRQNKRNWDDWLKQRAADESDGLAPEAVMQKVATMVGPRDTYGVDTGNVSEWAVRGLPMDHEQRFALSGLFATMGFGLPAGMAGALSVPDSQAWSFSGDGGFAMVAPDIITEARYGLPVINVIFSNQRFGFIYREQVDTKQHLYGVDLTDADWAKVADGLGGIGFTVQNNQEVEDVFDQIKQLQAKGNRKPIVVNAVIKNDDPIGTAYMPLDPQLYGQEAVDEYAKANHIDIEQQPSLGALLRAQGDNL